MAPWCSATPHISAWANFVPPQINLIIKPMGALSPRHEHLELPAGTFCVLPQTGVRDSYYAVEDQSSKRVHDGEPICNLLILLADSLKGT